MKYFRLKFFIFILKNIFYKIRYGENITFKSLRVGFENNCIVIMKGNGKIILGHMNYFTRFTNIEVYGGVIELGNNVSFNKNCNIVSRKKIKIGNYCIFGPNVSIYDHDHGTSLNNNVFSKQKFNVKDINIGNNVWLGAGVVVLPGVIIGNNVVVGANAVVTKNLESNSLYAGVPAKKIKVLK